MRIIKLGYAVEKEFDCRHCGSTIGYLPKDVEKSAVDKCEFIHCPVCKHENKLYKP